MTEQSKIPLPPKGEGNDEQGNSLFERASGAFGGFKPAPVPADLATPATRRARKVTLEEVVETVEQTAAPLEGTEQEATAGAVLTVEPVHFNGEKYRVDRARLRELGLIVPGSEVTALLEEFRIVKRQLLQAARVAQRNGAGSAAQRVLVCSPLPGEGKTFCATNLALAIAAEKDSEVLLVDADFAKPSIMSLLGLPAGGPGLMDALANPSLSVEDCVVGTDVPGLHVLPAGNKSASDSEFLASNRTGEVLDRLTQGVPNRIVIFDSPPALAASPAAELANHVGQALLIARADRTGQSAIEDALSLLATCPDIKLLLNAANFSPSGRRFGSYYSGEGDDEE